MRLGIKTMLLVLSILFLIQKDIAAQNTYPLSSDSGIHHKVLLSSYLSVLNEDTGSSRLLNDTTLKINASHTIGFSITNTDSLALECVIVFGEPYLKVKNVRILSDVDDEVKIGEAAGSVKLSFKPGETKKIYFSIREINIQDPNKVSVYLSSVSLNQKIALLESKIQVTFLSILLFLGIFNLLLYFSTKWIVYIKYAAYIFISLLYFSFYYGVLQDFFPAMSDWSSNLVHIWYSLIFISYFYFIMHFGDYKTSVPTAYYLLNVGIIYKLLQSLFSTIFHFARSDFIYSNVYLYGAMIFEILLMCSILYYILKNKNTIGKIVIFASFFIIVGGILDQVIQLKNFEHTYFIESAIVLELLTFSVGLGVVFRQYYKDKNEAQALYIRQLHQNEKIKAEFTQKLEKEILVATEELENEKKQVEKKNHENEILLGEVHHRVKNNLQMISSMFSLQERSIQDEVARNAIIESRERITSMMLMHKMLYQTDSYLILDMESFTYKLIDSFGSHMKNIKTSIEIKNIKLDIDTALPLSLIINELILNSLKYAFKNITEPEIGIRIFEQDKSLILYYSDNGPGKKESIEEADSFGNKLLKSLTRQLSGAINVSNEEGLHYTFTFEEYKLEKDEN